LNHGANIHATDNDGSTPLHFAAEYGNLEVVKLLLKRGADKNLKDKYGNTPLESAKSRHQPHVGPLWNNTEVIEALQSDRIPLQSDRSIFKRLRKYIYESLLQ